MLAQIDVGGMINGGLSAASDAGVVISTLVFLAVLVIGVGWVSWLVFRHMKDTREATLAEKKAEREARAEERKATADALRDATHTNRELLERLEQLTETQEKMADAHKQSNTNQETLTRGVEQLMTAINDSEETRAQRYAELFQQRADDHKAVEDVSAALRGVQTELAGLKEGVNTLEESINNKIGLTESDRNKIKALLEKTNELLTRIEENEHETPTDPTHPADADDPASAGTIDAGADSGSDA